MFCCTLLCVHSSIAIILVGKRELIALLNLSSWCLVMVERLFLAVPQGCLRFVIVDFPDHTHLLFLWIIMLFLSCFCYAFMRVCLLMSCGHLLGKGRPLGSRLGCLIMKLSLSHWYPKSGMVLDCIES